MGQTFSRNSSSSNEDAYGPGLCQNCNTETNNHLCRNCNYQSRQAPPPQDFHSNNRNSPPNNDTGNKCIIYGNPRCVINNPSNYYYGDSHKDQQTQMQEPSQHRPQNENQRRPQPNNQRGIMINSRLRSPNNEEVQRSLYLNAIRMSGLPPSPSDSFIHSNYGHGMYMNTHDNNNNNNNNGYYNYQHYHSYQHPYEFNSLTPSPSPPTTSTTNSIHSVTNTFPSNVQYRYGYVLSSSVPSTSSSPLHQRSLRSYASCSSFSGQKPNEYTEQSEVEGMKRVRFAN